MNHKLFFGLGSTALFFLATCAMAMETLPASRMFPLIVDVKKANPHQQFYKVRGVVELTDLSLKAKVTKDKKMFMITFFTSDNRAAGSLHLDKDILGIEVNDGLVDVHISSPRYVETLSIRMLPNINHLTHRQKKFLFDVAELLFLRIFKGEASVELSFLELVSFQQLPVDIQMALEPYVVIPGKNCPPPRKIPHEAL